MSASGLKSIFSAGDDILSSERDSNKRNTILVQLGDASIDKNNSTGGTAAEWWQHVGFASIPSPVSGTGKNADCAQAITINRSDYDIVIASRDTRYQDIYANLKPGEACVYATGDGTAQARALFKADGSINLFSRVGNSASGKGMGIFINAKDNSISALTGSGSALQLDSDGAKLFHSAGALVIDSGVTLSSTGSVNISGTNIVLGGATAKPVLTVNDLAAIFELISSALGAITPTSGGATGVTIITNGLAKLITDASLKRTSAQ